MWVCYGSQDTVDDEQESWELIPMYDGVFLGWERFLLEETRSMVEIRQ